MRKILDMARVQKAGKTKTELKTAFGYIVTAGNFRARLKKNFDNEINIDYTFTVNN